MTLIQEIKSNGNLRRLFGKRELKIVEKQLMGVKLKPSEVIRLSRDIRKKFEAIEGLCKYSPEFKIKKGAEIQRIVNETKQTILESRYFPQIEQIVLFGSAAENKMRLDSDIDLAVDLKGADKRDATIFRMEILAKISEKVDIQVFSTLPEKIKNEIKEKGRIIYEKKN